MRKLTFIGIALGLLLGLALRREPAQVAAEAAPMVATFIVSNTNDAGPGSLRQAILDANASPGADVIDATGVAGTITVNPANYFLVITDDVAINGPGQANLTISGGNASRIFWIQNGTITIQNLTLANGYARGGNGGGGGMGAGGAIFMHEGRQDPATATGVLSGNLSLRLINVALSGNRAQGGNGGFGNTGGGGMGGNAAIPGPTCCHGTPGGVLGNGVGWEYGGSVTDSTTSGPGTNGGIAIFGNGGRYGYNNAGFGGGGGGGRNGGFAGGGGNAQDGGGSGGRGGFGGGGGGAGADNGYLNNGGRNGGFGGGGGGLQYRCTVCSPGGGGDDGAGGFGAGNGTDTGGGGLGAGGAIFVASGSLSLENVTFQNNSATGGTGGNNGQGLGGALFIFNKANNGNVAAPGTTQDPQVSGCNVSFSGNTASTGSNDAYGAIGASSACTTLSINNVTQSELNSGASTFAFTVSLAAPAGPGGVTFDIATQDDTATTANNDYVAKSLTGQAIPAGSSTYTFNVTVNGDTAVEPDETFLVNITNVVGAIVSDSQGAGTITNEDAAPLPLLTINNVSQYEGNSGPVTFTFTVSLSAPAGAGGVTFDIGTQDGTATEADNDYEPLSLTGQTIPAGSSTYTFSVTVNGDVTVEADQTFSVNVTNVIGATVSDGEGAGTIRNDDSSGFAFTGFFQPIDNLPTINTVTAGQAIPVKFSLGGYQGMSIFAASYPASIMVVCSSGTPTDAIEETVTAGSSGLSYDATTDQYKYTWKTERVWRGTCRKLVVRFTDGTTREARFQFR